jgi:trehalose 6-phosphate synthase
LARLVIVSNRVPAARERSQPAGGLTVALKDAILRRETLWFGWSGHLTSGQTAFEPSIRPGRPTFATIDLPQEAFRSFYEGFSNSTLWPLLHWRPGLAEFRRDELDAYYAVNDMFAAALAPLLRADDVVWIHDYHLSPLGAALRARGAAQRLGFFLHVPFPPAPLFDTLPQAGQLLKALGAYDLVGVQTRADATYLQTAVRSVGGSVPVAPFPVDIDANAFEKLARQAQAIKDTERLHASLAGRTLILGVDRLDYSKGLPERFRGYAQLLRRFPAHRNHVTFIQVAPVSRGNVAHYRALRRELDELTGRINGDLAEFDWTPLRYITRSLPRDAGRLPSAGPGGAGDAAARRHEPGCQGIHRRAAPGRPGNRGAVALRRGGRGTDGCPARQSQRSGRDCRRPGCGAVDAAGGEEKALGEHDASGQAPLGTRLGRVVSRTPGRSGPAGRIGVETGARAARLLCRRGGRRPGIHVLRC